MVHICFRSSYHATKFKLTGGDYLKFLDLFSGLGGFRTGLESVGFEAYGWVEWDKFARQSYEAIHDTEGEWTRTDITDVTDEEFSELEGEVELITGGFPCQTFSYAGQRKGFDDTRGTMFFEIARAAKHIRPKYMLLENVKGLVSHNKGDTLDTIFKVLNDLGYIVDFEILNSKYFGVPQNRERIFIVAVRDDLIEPEEWIIEGDNVVAKGKRRIKEYDWARTFNFDYPQGWELDLKLKDIMEPEVEERFYLNKEQTDKLVLNSSGIESDIKQVARYDSPTRKNTNQYRTYSPEGISPSLTSMGGGGREPHVMTEVKDVGFIDRRGTGKQHQSNTVYNEEGLSPTMQARDYKDPAKVLIGASRGRNPANPSDRTTGAPTEQRLEINENGTSNTLTSVQKDNYVVEIGQDITIRKLTPKECFRLQAFTDDQFMKAQEDGLSNTQLYKQAGNAVTVNVIIELAKKIKKLDKELQL